MDYCTLFDLKQAMNIVDTVDDSRLANAISSSSRWVESYCGRTFQPAGSAVKTYIPSGRIDPLPIDDAVSIIEVAIDDTLDGTFPTVLTTADWQAEPVNTVQTGIEYPYTRLTPQENGYWPTYQGRATVRVTALFGWPDVPQAIQQATLMQSMRLFKRLDAPLGVMGFGDMGVVRVSRFADPDVEMLLAPFRRRVFR